MMLKFRWTTFRGAAFRWTTFRGAASSGAASSGAPSSGAAFGGAALLALALFPACTGPRFAARDYSRPGLSEVRTERVAIIAVAARPQRMTTAQLDFEPFVPPQPDERLYAMDWSPPFSNALAEASQRYLESAGFQTERVDVEHDTTLEQAETTSDVLLVVRAVPVVRLYVGEEAAVSAIAPGAGLEDGGLLLPEAGLSATRIDGGLMVGQAFLYDQKSGVRLWSRQLPGAPQDRILRKDGYLLRFGSKAKKASEAQIAAGFVKAMFETFPSPSSGTPEGRAQLDRLDLDAEMSAQSFFDKTELMLDLGADWTFESASSTFEGSVPDLEVGELAPLGAGRLQLGATLKLAGGFTLRGTGFLGTLPGDSLERAVVQTVSEAEDLVVQSQSVERGLVVGGSLGLGGLLGLGSDLYLHPMGSAFLEVWEIEGEQNGGNRTRFGLQGELELWWRVAPSLALRAGPKIRLGIDDQGPAFAGLGVQFGASWIF